MRSVAILPLVTLALACGAGSSALAQNYASSGQSWSSSYGFSSATDRSLRLQQAQVVRTAEQGADPTSVYNTTNYYDNRSGYIETNATGDVTGDQQIGDQIGQQTYSVGSLNTGSNTIEVHGSGNVIDAVNAARTNGCVDGSIREVNTTTGGTAWATTDGSASAASEVSTSAATAAVDPICQ